MAGSSIYFANSPEGARTFMWARSLVGPPGAMVDGWNGPLEQVDSFRFQIPRSYKPQMRTSGLIFVDQPMIPQLRQDRAPEQVANVATMPGIVGMAMAMPDIHWGYGFPIGGVAAFDYDAGVISPGGIGYDVNCGVRLIRTDLTEADVRPHLRALTDACFKNVPSGVGEGGLVKVSRQDLAKIDSVGTVCIMVHTGSRGFGHQIASDYIEACERVVKREKIELPDLQLACAPIGSKEGQDYWRAMCCGANFAWNNRQLITFGVRNAFADVLRRSADDLGMGIVYDVCHNIGKVEEHHVDGVRQKVVVHRKGATRAFPAGHPETPAQYKDVGQPVLIPGDMGTCSFVLVGQPTAMERSFGSSCHGAGRQMSRKAASRTYDANEVVRSLEKRGIYLRAASRAGIVEEAPGAYKNVADVVRVAEGAGLTQLVARMVPLGVGKG